MSKIKFEPGFIYKNRSFAYIAPILSYWGDDFVNQFNKLTKIAFGIGDEKKDYKGIYVLFDVNGPIYAGRYRDIATGRNTFFDTLEYFREQDFFIADYPYDDLSLGHQHMVVFSLPDEFQDAIEKFKEGKYSEIYTNPDEYIRKKTSRGEYNDAYKVITKSPQFFHKFNQRLKRDFDVLLEFNDGRELDYPPVLNQEIF